MSNIITYASSIPGLSISVLFLPNDFLQYLKSDIVRHHIKKNSNLPGQWFNLQTTHGGTESRKNKPSHVSCEMGWVWCIPVMNEVWCRGESMSLGGGGKLGMYACNYESMYATRFFKVAPFGPKSDLFSS